MSAKQMVGGSVRDQFDQSSPIPRHKRPRQLIERQNAGLDLAACRPRRSLGQPDGGNLRSVKVTIGIDAAS
jgi:hypothetical protein